MEGQTEREIMIDREREREDQKRDGKSIILIDH